MSDALKLTITPTAEIETVEGAPCRAWVGTTAHGVPVRVWVRMISPRTDDPDALAAFDVALQRLPPVKSALVSFDLRFVT